MGTKATHHGRLISKHISETDCLCSAGGASARKKAPAGRHQPDQSRPRRRPAAASQRDLDADMAQQVRFPIAFPDTFSTDSGLFHAPEEQSCENGGGAR